MNKSDLKNNLPDNQIQRLFKLYNYANEYKFSIILATFYSIINKVLDLFPPLLIGLAVDTIVKGNKSVIGQLGDFTQYQQLWMIAIFTIFIWVLESIFEYLFTVKWKYIAQVIQHKLRMNSFDHLLKMDHTYFESQNSGQLISIINDDVNQLERFLDGGINDLIQVTVTVLVIGTLYFIKSPLLASLSFLSMPLIIYGGIWFQQFLAPRYREVRNKVGLLTSELNNNLQGINTIKSFAREKESFDQLNKFSMEYFKANEQAIYVSSMFTPLIRMLVMFGFLTTLLVGGHLTLSGQMEVGTFSVLIIMIQRLLWPLTRLGQTLDLFQRSMASVYRIFNLLNTNFDLQSGSALLDKTNIKGKIEFKNIDFNYSDNLPLLKNLSLKIEAGQSIGIVGSTGSGKSTIIKLLQRFYDPKYGEILIDNVNLKDLNLNSLRSAISVVSQDVYLFHGTLIENLKFANPKATEAQIMTACETACIHDFILTLPNKYNTIVGERGQRLSGGQKQRVSIARMLLADSPIVVLDEATSAVDNITEAELQLNLNKCLKNKTTIVIAHRLSTVINCNRVIVLENGQIIEDGIHNDLIKRQGIYQRLWSVQTGLNLSLN